MLGSTIENIANEFSKEDVESHKNAHDQKHLNK